MTRKRTDRSKSEGEDRLFQRIRRTLTRDKSQLGLQLGIGDDAAIWRPRPGYETAASCDWFLQGSHFLLDRHPPDSVGWKSLARAVSDLAAMGAEPRCFLLSLALPSSLMITWLTKLLKGLARASAKFKCPVAGGDTTRSKKVLINLTVLGECKRRHAILRSTAKADDVLFVTGRLGEAELGLQLLKQGARGSKAPALRKHLYPEPRLSVGAWLAKRGFATAMMDLSDGLSSDLARLCRASGVGCRIEETLIPHVESGPYAAHGNPLTLALHGGDDYELLFSVSPRNACRIPSRIGGVSISRIGEVTRNSGLRLVRSDGTVERLSAKGWDPFRT
jgi:thiamine-monophosphate kinase